jgi:asparagine synthase (glutamine-hydrolysing)
MCGIAGVARRHPVGISLDVLGRMAAAIRHRGPDGYGFFTSPLVGLAHLRLSIIDLAGGAQPMTNEDGSVVISYNGEVYNYRELMVELQARGHQFQTQSDTEVLVHGWEEWGHGLFQRLNGQFAFALYDRRTEQLVLARDRFGVRPLFYAEREGDLYFGSEVKALLASGAVTPEPDPLGLDQVFTFWAARPPRTPFRDIWSLEPGTWAVWRAGRLEIRRHYALEYPEQGDEPLDALQCLDEVMHSSVALRLRADVPVGAYLSGGLDSSITSALAAQASPFTLRTFSITFQDPRFDESEFQQAVANAVGSSHKVRHIRNADIAAVFPSVIRHTETPLLRTAAAPMYHLAQATREAGITVVLTGEGADELFLGYDLFKEVAIRLFCLAQPESTSRPRLFDRLYPYLTTGSGSKGGEMWQRSFLGAGAPGDPLLSHLPRFRTAGWLREFYAAPMAEVTSRHDALEELRGTLPGEFSRWSPLNQASYLEMVTLLSPYLLSSQADRVGMAHAVEGRYPFLDHRLFELAASLPTKSRLLGLREKRILRRWARELLPPAVLERTKQPYRAPDAPPFLEPGAPAWVATALSPESVLAAGAFEPAAVAGLIKRCREGRAAGIREQQALVGILSYQAWHREFIRDFRAPEPLAIGGADVVMQPSLAGSGA